MTDLVLETDRLILRNWQDADRPAFHRLNSDENVMTYFPFRRTRKEADRVMDEIISLYRSQGYCFGAVEHRQTGECMGMCGITATNLIAAYPQGTVEIGWRFLPEVWGKGYATEAAHAWLTHAFDTLNLPEIVAFAVEDNKASTNVMQRLGMSHKPELDFDHPKVQVPYLHLRRHVTYVITSKEWAA